MGTGYFDEVATVISGGRTSTAALKGSTEEEQFSAPPKKQNGTKAQGLAARAVEPVAAVEFEDDTLAEAQSLGAEAECTSGDESAFI